MRVAAAMISCCATLANVAPVTREIQEPVSMFHYFFKEKAMKRQLATTAAVIGFAAVSVHAQMSGGQGGMGTLGQGMSIVIEIQTSAALSL